MPDEKMNMSEIKKFMDLLREWGFGGGYALTGPVENPIITSWKATATFQSSEQKEAEG